ncbi:hypothetical protein NHQ30_000428 [Ciborinia camelliae]|nr:hypothetical protein NHQ30_000428 [Ciborinia camelliae]
MPKFEQAGKFTGVNQSASRWLERIKLDFASSDYDFIPIDMYVRAIDVLLEGPAAYWCDSVPEIKHIFENYKRANAADVKWLERELIEQFPGNIINNPVDRIITWDRSYLIDASEDTESVTTRLDELYIGEKTKSPDQKPKIHEATQRHCKDRYHDDRHHRCETSQRTMEVKRVIDEYQFCNRPRTQRSSPEYYKDQNHGTTTGTKISPASKTHNSDRTQKPVTLRSILKNGPSYNRQRNIHAGNSQERIRDHSRSRSPPHFRNHHSTNHCRKPQASQPRQSFYSHESTSCPFESRPVHQNSRTLYREVTIVTSKPEQRHWSYVPHLASQTSRYPAQRSTDLIIEIFD